MVKTVYSFNLGYLVYLKFPLKICFFALFLHKICLPKERWMQISGGGSAGRRYNFLHTLWFPMWSLLKFWYEGTYLKYIISVNAASWCRDINCTSMDIRSLTILSTLFLGAVYYPNQPVPVSPWVFDRRDLYKTLPLHLFSKKTPSSKILLFSINRM